MKRSKSLIWAAVLPVAGLILASCGGGDGGGGSSSSSTSTVALGAEVSSSMLSIGGMALDAAGGDASSGVGMRRNVNLSKSMAALNRTVSKKGARMIGASVLPQTACDSGTATSDGTTTTYSQCVYVFGDTKFYFDGSISYTDTGTGFTSVAGSANNPYVIRIYQVVNAADVLLSETSMTLSFNGTFNGSESCGAGTIYTSTSIAMSGSMSFIENSVDGAAIENGSATLTNMVVDATSSNFDSVTCEPANVALTMSGSASSVDNLDSSNSMSLSISEASPLSIQWADTGLIIEVEVNGTMTVAASCFNGTLTIATTTPIQVPDTDEEACPIAGVVTLTGSMTGTVTYNSNGSVSIDEGSNGSVDQTLASCNDAGTCS